MSSKFQNFKKWPQWFSTLTLRWKIYILLVAILLPVFTLTIFVQTQLTQPLLEEEVRQIGISVCRSLEAEIKAFHLLGKIPQLEARLVEVSWLQPSIVRIDVITKENGAPPKLLASNIVEDTAADLGSLVFDENKRTEHRNDESRNYWDIVYPIKDRRKVLAYLHAEVSLQLVDRVVATFSKIELLGALLSVGLLILLLSYYLRRMIENEQRLRAAETHNIELTEKLHDAQRQVFLNEKLAIMGQLTASFAHEIGTPLNSVSGHLQLLRDEVRDEKVKNRFEIINSQVSRIETIVRDFLASTHAPIQQRELVNVQKVIERIIALVAPRIQALGIDVVVKVDSIESIRIVPSDLEQILLNLTNNALDALEQRSNRSLVFRATMNSSTQKSLEVHVFDSGEGIAPKDIKQVLKPFFTTKAPGQGTGLGLSICQRLVKKYSGKLEIESTLGSGTTVKVSIPYEA